MKKLLALVLALVMTLSLCTISNAAFTDAKDVDASYEEAVAVLNGMGVFKGYEDGSFKPEGSITRAEVAAIVYRLYTGDVKDKQAGLYAGYGKFDDMAGAAWAAGYVGFCANAGFVKGYGDGKFGPSDPVTGYQALAMILRAVGYGKNGEFEGADWELHVAQIAQQLKVLKNVKGVSLKAAASRELVAELLFQVAAYVDTVEYTPAFGYVSNTVVTAKAETLGEKNFNLTKSADGADNWGRPQYKWFSDDNGNKTVDAKETKYATIQAKPEATYTTAVQECQVASDLGLKTVTTYPAYTNGVVNKGSFTVEPTDTRNVLGAQGRLTEVYEDRIVMIDTFLAQVKTVTPATFDAAGHLAKYATMELEVYDGTTTIIWESASTDFEFVKGDYVLLNAYSEGWTAGTFSDDVKTEMKKINNENKPVASYVEIVGKATSVTGAQTSILVNAKQHIVNGTTYNDANTYYLDQAGQTPFVNFTWFFDSYGNVIGSAKIAATYSYAVLKSLYWNLGTPGYATATLIDAATGAETTVTVSSIDGDVDDVAATPANFNWDKLNATPLYSGNTYGFNGDYAYVAPETFMVNNPYLGYALYRVETLSTGAVKLEGVNKAATGNTTVSKHDTGVTITNGQTYMYANTAWNVINDDTVFTVRSGNGTTVPYSYTQYVGKNNVPTITGAEVFYVNADADTYIEYVYVKTGTIDNSTKNFVMATGTTYYNNLYNNANVYVLCNAYVNGELKPEAIKTLDPDDITALINGVNAPFYVTYGTNGMVDTVTAFSTHRVSGDYTQIGTSNLYYGKIESVVACDGNTLVVNGGVSFAINTAKVIGSYAAATDVANWSDVNVYIVYSKTVGGDRVVSQLYIIDKGLGGNPGTQGPAAGKAVVNYQIKVVDSYGVEKNVINAATWTSASAVNATGVTYANLIDAMTADGADWVNADGAVATLTALGIYDNTLTGVASVDVVCDLGQAVTVTFVVKK